MIAADHKNLIFQMFLLPLFFRALAEATPLRWTHQSVNRPMVPHGD